MRNRLFALILAGFMSVSSILPAYAADSSVIDDNISGVSVLDETVDAGEIEEISSVEAETSSDTADISEDAAETSSDVDFSADAEDGVDISDDVVEAEAVTPAKPDWNEPPVQQTEQIGISEEEAAKYYSQNEVATLGTSASGLDERDIVLALCSKVRTALLKGNSIINVTGYNIVVNSLVSVRGFTYYCPYFDGVHIKGTLYYVNNRYVYLQLANTLTKAQTKTWINTIDTKVAEINTLMNNADLNSVADQALYLHDYMASHYYYDTNLKEYYPSIMLTKHLGVCQSYAYLFQYIMNKRGVECYTTSSDTHAWNIIKINGKYYNIDVTWDDPTDDYYGQARHDYFLISDASLLADPYENGSHSGRNCANIICSDDSYENDYFADAMSPVYLNGSDRYFIKGNYLVKYNISSGSQKVIDNLGKWYVWGQNSYYTIGFSGLSDYENVLYYNTAGAVKCYDLSSGEISTYTTVDTSKGYIFGSVFYGNQLTYDLDQETDVKYAQKNIQKNTLACNSHIWNGGVVTTSSTCTVKGVKTFTCIKCGESYTQALALASHTKVTDKAVAATVFKTGKTAGSHCSVCKKVLTAQKTIAKLKPTIKLSKTSVKIKKKKKVTIKVSKLAKGDSVKSWKSSNKKVATVTSKGVIKGKKKGKATITVTLKSGKKASVKVRVK